jgi:hypothetical protein
MRARHISPHRRVKSRATAGGLVPQVLDYGSQPICQLVGRRVLHQRRCKAGTFRRKPQSSPTSLPNRTCVHWQAKHSS